MHDLGARIDRLPVGAGPAFLHPPRWIETVLGRLGAKWLLALLVGVSSATVALILRLQLPIRLGGEQAIFAYPAIVAATIIYGARAGSVTGCICFPLLWYFVLPPRRSFALEGYPAIVGLLMYVLVGAALIWSVAGMRRTVRELRTLNLDLEGLVEQRTAERNRLWQRSRELLAIVRPDGRVRDANPALRRLSLLGSDNGIETAPSFRDLLLSDDRAEYDRALASGALGFDARLTTAGDPAWIAWSLVEAADDTYLIGRDYTAEQHCAEQLRQSQKMEVVGQMAGGLAHDFGNLVPPISMTLHLLRRRHDDDSRTRDLIEVAEESVERADQLIKRLLALSQPSRLAVKPQAVGPVLEHIAPLLQQVTGGRTLLLRVDPDLPDVRVDANQLDMAVLNLVLNARDATDENGTLTLTAGSADGTHVSVTLSDDGCGMDAETLARATEPFYSTKASGRGSGLGLAMVHNFAVASGGTFSLKSEPGHGTHATVRLPYAQAADNE